MAGGWWKWLRSAAFPIMSTGAANCGFRRRSWWVAGCGWLAVPDLERRAIRLVGLENGRLIDVGRCALAAPLDKALQVVTPGELRVVQPQGKAVVIARDCTP